MAFSSTISSALLRLSNTAAMVETITFDDVQGDPATSINWMTGSGLVDVNLGVAATTVAAATPNEVATTATWSRMVTASGTAHTLDLKALTRSAELSDLDLEGLKVQGFVLAAPFANTDDVSVVVGATNGYDLTNDASAKIVVAPGGVHICYFPENTSNATGMPAVAAADKDLDFASAMSNFQFFMAIFAG